MEQTIADKLVDQEVELYCVGGERFQGKLGRVDAGVITLLWKERETYIACDKVVAVWRKEAEERATPHLGFVR